MNKSFLSNIVLLILANLLIKPIYIFYIDAEVQNVVGSISYEQFFVAFNICYILQFFNDFGIHSYSLKEVSQRREEADSLLSKLLGTKLLLAVFFSIAAVLAYFISGVDFTSLFFMVAFNVFLSSLLLYFRSNLSGLGWYRWDSIISILDKTILLIALAYVLYFSTFRSSFEILDFIRLQSTAFLISIGFCLVILWQKGQLYFPSFDYTAIKSTLRASAPYALIFLLMTAYSRVDAIMLRYLSYDSVTQIDAFAACYRLFEAGNMFAYLFAGLLLPMSAYLLQQKKDLKPLIWLGTRTMVVLVVIVGCSLYAFREPILMYLYERYDVFYPSILTGLLISFASVALAYVYGSVAVADGRIRELNYLFAICLLLNIILNFFLIPRYGAIGAAYTSAATQVLSLMGQLFIFQYFLKISWKWYEIWTILAYILLTALVYQALTNFLDFDWMYLMPLCIISALAIAFVSGMVDVKELKELLSSKIAKSPSQE